MPQDSEEWLELLRKNVWQAVYSIILFMSAFSYLQPYIETVQNIWLQRFNRVGVTLMLLYTCFLIFMINQRPEFGR
jgi:hypothetical protein